ncbi:MULTISPECIES: P-II family nitrogen regulator [Pseudanabaena]|uniref:Nitrogen regulatory protein P-II n=2 Tax=Pseudanabaena TaxID=1152 RepID=L8N6L3_9CYAN|nr:MULTISPECIES: P-II family nitrogen regulator [Pseudanabaena]ELS33868.1 nitrogen regulatory protein P-II [Pseudanabaena biceps PCC 7429]MDG3493895.1 P-II family nitrogen regulator [Pseudanabaena catenata USMAC16]
MDLIIAIIQPSKLDEVKDELVKIGVQGATVTGAKGFGRQKGRPLAFLGLQGFDRQPFSVDFIPKIKIEIVVSSDITDAVVDTIVKTAHSGKIGDGKVFVIPVKRAVRIRTGEENEEALSLEEALA